jgi:hypothetical protein
MLVRIIRSAVGPEMAFKKGEVVDLPPIKAQQFISIGIAVAEKPKHERSVLKLEDIETRIIRKDVQDSNSPSVGADNVSRSKAAPKSRKR